MKEREIFRVEDFNNLNLFEKVKEHGEVIIYESNEPKYIIKPIQNENIVLTDNELVEVVAKRILKKHKKAFEDLGKW